MTGSRPIWAQLGLDLVTLRIFTAAAEENNFARAAERECIALSAVSRRISYLEARTGVTLFERHDRGVTLTTVGETLYANLQNVFALLDLIAVDLQAFRGGEKGQIRIQAHMSATVGPLPRMLAQFAEEHPSITIELEERISNEVLHAVRTGMADIGLVSGTLSGGDLELIPWIDDELVVIVPRGHSLAARARLNLGDLLNEPFIGMQKNSALLDLYRKQAQVLGGNLRTRVYATSFESVRRMVSEGLGVAILPAIAVDPFKAALNIESRPLNETWARRSLMICIRNTAQLSPVSKLLVQSLIDAAATCKADLLN